MKTKTDRASEKERERQQNVCICLFMGFRVNLCFHSSRGNEKEGMRERD